MYKKDILNRLGKNHTTPCVFDKDWKFVEAIYTYKNDVYCLSMGEDFPFDDLSDREQSIVFQEITNGRYVLDETFQ